jgi:hypothetical protein
MQSGFALGAFSLHHIFLFAKNATHFFYRKQKNVIYLFALCEIGAKMVDNIKK